MRTEVVVWAAVALLLFAAEALAPGAFMLWMGFAATALFVAVWVVPGIPLLVQVVAFVVLSFVSVQIYRTWFRRGERQSDQPLLNRRAEQLIGRVVRVEQAIAGGRGRVKIDDAFWVVSGPDLPVGTEVRVVAVDGMTLKVQAA
ncbi:NfeD family protein [Stenotrophomonas sp. HITSZ_GD]|jgi:inner membrane protein|uniref:NfeD family protein n=1 Tax=Stenotrophomonas sp. HITSZ_GD TaxID=3037248 RepID=UPI00240DB70F|nr:NfeD family protein [Stenotrophomonas sp. HITSZ_GD]MDG2525428.1 NfeD family protein [Stenotrophomonas sp. HITSZ_GD]